MSDQEQKPQPQPQPQTQTEAEQEEAMRKKTAYKKATRYPPSGDRNLRRGGSGRSY